MAKAHKQSRRYERIRFDSGQHQRIMAVMAIFGLIAFLPAALRLHELMVLHYDYYAGLAQRNQSRTTPVAASRGTIYDTNMNRYVNKKKSSGKIDMVVALINATYLLQQDIIFEDGFICQTI